MTSFWIKLKNNYVFVLVNLFTSVFFLVFVSYIYATFWQNNFLKQSLKQVEYKIDKIKLTKKDSLTLDLNNKLLLMEAEVKRVETNNDKRFEVLGWSFGILSTFISIILLVNIVNSRTTNRDIIKDEINNSSSEIKEKYEKIVRELEAIKVEYDAELKRLRNNTIE